MDLLVAAGLKRRKQFAINTKPGASPVWYGFHGQRDLEIRSYGSRENTLGWGGESAQAAVGHSPNSNRCGGIDAAILCHAKITTCEELAAQLR